MRSTRAHDGRDASQWVSGRPERAIEQKVRQVLNFFQRVEGVLVPIINSFSRSFGRRTYERVNGYRSQSVRFALATAIHPAVSQ